MSRTYRRESPNAWCYGVEGRDKRPGRRHAPAWYRRLLNRFYRRRVKAAIHRGMDPPPRKRNADSKWF